MTQPRRRVHKRSIVFELNQSALCLVTSNYVTLPRLCFRVTLRLSDVASHSIHLQAPPPTSHFYPTGGHLSHFTSFCIPLLHIENAGQDDANNVAQREPKLRSVPYNDNDDDRRLGDATAATTVPRKRAFVSFFERLSEIFDREHVRAFTARDRCRSVRFCVWRIRGAP
jgi:hypothetical protein